MARVSIPTSRFFIFIFLFFFLFIYTDNTRKHHSRSVYSQRIDGRVIIPQKMVKQRSQQGQSNENDQFIYFGSAHEAGAQTTSVSILCIVVVHLLVVVSACPPCRVSIGTLPTAWDLLPSTAAQPKKQPQQPSRREKGKNKLRKFAGSCGSPCLCTRQVLWDYNCYFFWGGEERLFAGKKGRAYQSHHNWAVEYGSNVRDSSSSSSDQSLPPLVCVCVGDLCPWFWSGSFHTGGGDKDITASQIRLEMACWISRCLSHVSVETQCWEIIRDSNQDVFSFPFFSLAFSCLSLLSDEYLLLGDPLNPHFLCDFWASQKPSVMGCQQSSNNPRQQ